MKASIYIFKNKIVQNILFSFLFIFFCACTNNKESTHKKTNSTPTQDSISSWITSAKNKKISKQERLAFLEKAYLKNKRQPKDSIASQTLSEISLRYSLLKDTLWFRKTNQETIVLAKKVQDSTTIANSYWDLANFLDDVNVKDSAFFYYHQAQKIFSAKKNNYGAGRMLKEMAWIQLSINDNTGAEINCTKAIELIKPLKNYDALASFYSTMGVIASNLGEQEKSISYYEEALKYDNNKPKNQSPNYNILNNLGIAYTRDKQYSKTIPYFTQLIQIDSFYSKNPGLYSTALNNLAYSNLKLNRLDSVEINLKKALKIRENLNETAHISASHCNLGEYYLTKKDTIKALQELKLSEVYAKQSLNNDRLLQVLELLALANPKKAADYRLEHIQLTDSLQKEERKIRNKFARIRFETDEFIAENLLLERQKQLWTGIAIGSILLLISIYIIVSQRAKNQKLRFNQQQQAKNQEVFDLMLAQKQKVEQAKRQEQKRISEELHDGVLGKMLGARMILTGLNKKIDDESIAEKAKAIVALKNVEGEVRSISHELNHSAYQKIPNFINSITELLQSHAKNAKIEQEFNFDNTMDWDTLSGDIKINVYRMIQECIHNSIKHANCNKVYVIFEIHKSNFEVTVGDDGQGYVLNKEKKGIGLRNIKSRMEKLNGHFTVDTAPGRGTSFFFNIPVSDVSKYEESEIPA
ncbi:ATP-binding protein [uncultured Maribacter sp.]|uniref:ATP-binding protein n=1 Tax=uncultured Maribacter sp. TaxID=431308 RepID=UPI002612E2A4|nr:ATP-binding protein [uncultured Maribacter sp.]